MKIKVCHIVSGDLWAGSEVMVYNLLKCLVKYKEIDLHLLILNEGKLAEEIKKLEIPVYTIDERHFSILSIFQQLRNILSIIKPNIIHSHRYKENILSYLVAKTTIINNNIKLISTQHGMPLLKYPIHNINGKNKIFNIPLSEIEEKNFRKYILKYNYYLLARHYNCTVAVSKDIYHMLLHAGKFSKKNIAVIYNGVEIPGIEKERKRKNYFAIGSAGRLFSIKNFPLFVEIAKIISEKHENVKYVLAGDGPDRLKLQTMVEKYDLGKNFEFKGFLTDINEFYKEIDIYLNTSFHEGFPISILEALSYGIPVVAPAIGGLSEIIDDGKDGLLAYTRDPLEYAQKCITIMTDKDLRTRMAYSGMKKIENTFSNRKMADSYWKLYIDILKET